MEQSIKKNLSYSFAYQLLSILLPLITTPYISRVLGPTLLGEYSYSYAIGYYFVMFIMLGLNNYGSKTIASVRDNKDVLSKTFCSIYIMQLLDGLLVLVIYYIFGFFFSNKTITWLIGLYVVSAIFDINWFFFGLEQFKLTVTRNALIKIVTTICIFLFVKADNALVIYTIIMVSGLVASQLVLWPFVRKHIVFTKVTREDVTTHIKPNLILFIPIFAVSLYKVMDKIMLGIMTNKSEVGLYESSERIIQIPMAFIQSMGTVMLPKMSNLVSKHDTMRSKQYMSSSIMLVMFLSSSLCFGIMGLARYFVPVYYGPGYEKCIILFQILLPSCLFLAFANVIRTQYLIPNDKNTIFVVSVFLGAVVNIISNIILIPRLESYGAAIGTLLAEITVCVYQAIKVRNSIEIIRYLKQSYSFVISGIVMYFVLQMIHFDYSSIVNMLLLLPIGVVVYFITLFILVLFFGDHNDIKLPYRR